MTPIDFGGGMIFPSGYDRDPPDAPECPCADGEPCPEHPYDNTVDWDPDEEQWPSNEGMGHTRIADVANWAAEQQ